MPGPFFDIGGQPGDGYATWAPAPPGWVTRLEREWRHVRPEQSVLPEQGWKIHVSAVASTAVEVLQNVHDYCVRHALAYKHLVSPVALLRRNSKYAPRGASGKFVTVYPPDEQSLAAALTALDAKLGGRPGAYVLSDLRIGKGPLYVRYGGFRPMWATDGGRRVAAIRRPDGTLVPDRRTAAFTVPEWVTVPEALAPHLAARTGGGNLPYRVARALHFSNGGGVYRATRIADEQAVVLKEARPHAGLDDRGVDAVQRLRHEHRVWSELAGLPGVPRVHELFTAWEHTFLAMQDVPGVHLGRWMARHYPLHAETSPEERAAYARRAVALADRLTRVVAGLHERGWVFGDLHPRNVLVDDEDNPVLIDAEVAFPAGEDHRPALGTPGFRHPQLRGTAVDHYALAAIRWWLWLPLAAMDELVPPVGDDQLDWVHEWFGVPVADLESLRRTLRSGERRYRARPADPITDAAGLRAALIRSVHASATPERTDRLFPGDVEQFDSGGLGFGHGACGVLYALHAAGEQVPGHYRQWLLDRVREEPPAHPGFWTGAHGVAWTLELLGEPAQADAVLAGCPDDRVGGPGLAHGRAGAALALIDLAESRHDDRFTARATALADGLDPDALPPGLFNGAAGVALAFLRLHTVTGAAGWLSRAEHALDQALAGCVDTGHGLAVADGETTLPYLEQGSAGVAVVLAELARHRPTALAVRKLPELLRACEAAFTVYPGLLNGRAGLLTVTTDADRHLAGLRLHAAGYADGVAYPGTSLRRLSMDLHTGTAGVLLALATLRRPALPLVTPLIGLRPLPAGKGKRLEGIPHGRDPRAARAVR
ncbi:class III lanthionine synthetase LanKC [Actinoplanes sp. NPDC051861]|uniref:class III lanthionine synthetase LanKC n=1 Tax=Actinoplanes sp. NPDC051861 TaxID=3155170 RepID=UPI003435C13C